MPIRSFLFVLVLLFTACKGDDDSALINTGSGQYNFTGYPPFATKPVKCFYHIPENSGLNSPILIAVHGAGRNAGALRNDLVSAANEKNFIVLAPEFSDDYFPGTNAFNLANIFTNGEDPSPSGLQDKENWTFKVLDPIFYDFKNFIGSTVSQYDIFGHSAGAQLVHRFLMFEPEAAFDRLVSSAAGWYMLPDANIDFPYGLGESPAALVDPASYFDRQVYVIVGAEDTDPNSFNLRHTPQADSQGINRAERAQFFFDRSSFIADSVGAGFQWRYHEAPGVGHDAAAMVSFAVSLLY